MTKTELADYRKQKIELHDLAERSEKCENGSLRLLYRKNAEILEQKEVEVELFIESIEDPLIRTLFRLVYMDGMGMEAAGDVVGYTKSAVWKIIARYTEKTERVGTCENRKC